MEKQIIFLFLFVLLITNVSAETFKQNSPVNIIHSVRTNGWVSSSLLCNTTVFNPAGSPIVNNKAMTYSSAGGTFNYTLPSTNTSLLGIYNYDITCQDTSQGLNTTQSFDLEVTPTGYEYTVQESLTYLALLAILIGIWGLCLWGAFTIPFRNITGQEGDIVQVNWRKYSKFGCMMLSYVLFVWIIFLAWNISFGFLHLTAMATAFYYIFRLLYALSIPVLVCTLIIGAIYYISDKKIQDKITKGYNFGYE